MQLVSILNPSLLMALAAVTNNQHEPSQSRFGDRDRDESTTRRKKETYTTGLQEQKQKNASIYVRYGTQTRT
ncbi:hypothetical protein B0H34DRAFT_707065 [Crassisporium funariophilum]|nr:hypothetical protein B0H34DRAFT_707065 [Crassisporium funariophilum]